MGFLDLLIALVCAVLIQQTQEKPAGALEAELRAENAAALARDARRLGDPRRGAVVFYQPAVTCAKCHVSESGSPALGPDLTATGKGMADEYLVEVDP